MQNSEARKRKVEQKLLSKKKDREVEELWDMFLAPAYGEEEG